MRKIVLLIVSCSSIVFADNKYSFLEKQSGENYVSVYEDHVIPSEEYEGYAGQLEDPITEYEQHVVDNVKPPKVSYVVALMRQAGCAVLIHYFVLQEKAKIYALKLKTFINKLFNFNKHK